ncbi:MAG: bifunctional oligoribonuclease/PAP phosphatase NrnA [Maribacter dokdonensis]|uniref:DHH family phosphoesterase n=2 Tax=Maribacter dokdonensis TaxID=320912 RepID=UPI001B1D40A7|nr:bifunctional oligoribonuclease/PAP phosphatase NrnA [Maribacter dokdonensis]MBU2901451.1 bifunctional oligoribonuclease/PAP phosphatase NrnA [Maribacter dokdonensis]MDP2527769.1 bifunctional oligoribonuclease/PAP phosphatase NrnA [Maribacter dokdonensis]CAG2535371.1 phosphoesterase RecJ domain-containing protein [Maribacter dokdonensis]|tara:strand:+ start:1108 stop:2124 length:1017 start_codon:yes stop_codon:yes gene_type:complete
MNLEHLNALKKLLSSPKKIAIIPHKNPDGDAIGSTLALWHYLSNNGHSATIVAPNDFPKFLKWMPGAQQILNFERENSQSKTVINEADIVFTLDFNHLGRVGQMSEILESAQATFVMVDHHQEPSDYASIMYSDVSMSSTCEMVYVLINQLGDENSITPDMANCIYTGIMTDTGSFKFAATTSNTHRVVADLMDKGAEGTEIHHRIYDTNSPSRLHLLGCALKNMVILNEYATAYITLSQEELDKYNYQKGDTEGFVNYGLTLDGIKFAVIFIENKEEGIFKISFRSVGDFSVNDFARKHFNGGGHTNAAGGRSEDNIADTIAKFTALLPLYKNQLQS